MRLLLTLIISLVSAWGARPCLAAGGADPFDFLFLDANARAVGMGGAYTALADDANALLYNPAGLGLAGRHEATFMHNEHVEGISQEYVGFVARQGWGVNLNYVNLGELDRTTVASPEGGLDRFSASDVAFGIGYGRAVHETLSLGAGFKIIRESIDDVSAQGYALDLGGLYSVPGISGLRLGLALQNMGPSVKYQSAKEKLPLNLRMGAAYGFAVLNQENTVSFDVAKQRSDAPLIGLGVETIVAGMMPVRLGFNARNDAGPGVTVGIGWMHENLSVDYGFVPYGDLGGAHRLSAAVRWGGERAPERELYAPRYEKSEPPKRPAETPENHFRKADEYIDSDLFNAAVRELDAARDLLDEKDRRLVRYFERQGYIAFVEREIETAKTHFREAIELAIRLGAAGPPVADAYGGTAMCHLEEGDAALAVRFFKKALEAGPSARSERFIRGKLRELEKSSPNAKGEE